MDPDKQSYIPVLWRGPRSKVGDHSDCHPSLETRRVPGTVLSGLLTFNPHNPDGQALLPLQSPTDEASVFWRSR